MWTPSALASELRPWRGRVWRLVEGQHRISTNRLADDLASQAVLEQLADAVKPQVPPAARHLDFLLATPFRYGHRQPSRFRRADERPGIFYAAEHEATAITEMAWWALRFIARSPGFAPPRTTIEYTSFHVAVGTAQALDLTAPPFAAERARWTDPLDYTACQTLATAARAIGTALLRTWSARTRQPAANVVVFDPAAFAEPAPTIARTWHFRHQAGRLVVLAAFPAADRFEFTPTEFGL